MNARCPRCGGKETRIEYEGREAQELVWTVWHCCACAFTWRDSEPAESIDPAARAQWFQVDPENTDQYHFNIPPAK